MTEDTRKDKRAKIVSLNVRYKSATVDEFIENHSHDVSKGGIFIKTPTPFPPGTLIKFEIRIAGDKPVITGVGRVVWKRDPSQAASDRPSGMGVKFIKIDEPSRQVIDRVVAEKEGAGSSYQAENETDSLTTTAARERPSDGPGANAMGTKPGLGSKPPIERKATLMGVGSPSSPPPADNAPSSVASSTVSPMFPSTTSEPEAGPTKEKTVMKQAAELLEEALKEAGGSMEEIGTNPLFAEGNKLDPRISSVDEVERKKTLVGMPSPSPAPPPERASGSQKSAKVASAPPADAPKKVTSDSPPRTTRETPSAKVSTSEARAKSERPATKKAVSASAVVAEPPKKSGSILPWIAAVAVIAAVGVYVYKGNLLGGGETPAATNPPPTAAPAPAPAPTPTVTTPPTVTSAAPSASATASAAPTASASASAAATTTKPTPTPTAATTTAAPTPAPAPAPKPKPAPAPTPTAAATPAPAPAPAPRPKPKPKPAATDDSDNPY